MNKIIVDPRDVEFLFDVREALDEDRVLHFVARLEAGETLEPLILDQDGKGIDGRHRVEAMIRKGVTVANATQLKFVDITEKLRHALRSNLGGPLPPKKGDLQYVIKQLIANNKAKKFIVELLSGAGMYSRQYVSNVYDDVFANIQKAVLQKAVKAISDDNITVTEAAERFDVNVDALKAHISRRKNADHQSDPKLRTASGPTAFAKTKKSTAQSFSAILNGASKLLEGGEISDDDFEELLNAMAGLAQDLKRALDDSIKRHIKKLEVYRGIPHDSKDIGGILGAKPKPVSRDSQGRLDWSEIPIGLEPQEFVRQAIIRCHDPKYFDLHVVWSGFNKEFNRRYKSTKKLEAVSYIKYLADQKIIVARVVRGAMAISLSPKEG
jgi:hypothetical protein